jgi:hypothetical protein
MKLHKRVPRQINRSILACALASCMAMATPQVMAQTANANLRGMVLTDSTPSPCSWRARRRGSSG